MSSWLTTSFRLPLGFLKGKNKKKFEKKYKINIKQVQFEQFCETNILIVNLKSSFDVLKVFWHVSAICLRNDYDRFYQNLRNTENIYFFNSWWWPACNGHSYCRQVTRFICVILRHAIQALKPKIKVSAPIWPPSICFMIKQAVSTGQV